MAGARPLVRRDGQVTELMVRPVAFGVADGNYHVAIRHRNHLGCMTASPVALSGTAAVLDLSVAGTQTWGVEARKSIGAVRALWAGNTVADANLKYTGGSNDRDPILTEIGGGADRNCFGLHRERREHGRPGEVHRRR